MNCNNYRIIMNYQTFIQQNCENLNVKTGKLPKIVGILE